VGAHESGLIGDNPNGIPNNLMPYVRLVARGDLPYLNVYGNDYPTKDGTGERDFIHVEDLTEGHLAALKFLLKRCGFNAFNIGAGEAKSVLDLVRVYEKISGNAIAIRQSPRRDGDLPVFYANVDKASKDLHWKAIKSLDDICISDWLWVTNSDFHTNIF
jgi:UDP-glucose 4-epimerase